MTQPHDFGARDTFRLTNGEEAVLYRLSALEKAGHCKLAELPYSIRVLLEAALRNHDGFLVRDEDVLKPRRAGRPTVPRVEIPFIPARVVLQDFTGVPCVVDMAALRNAMVELGGDPNKVNPPCRSTWSSTTPCRSTSPAGSPTPLERNMAIEYERNHERYAFLKWGQKNLDNFRAVPPGRGIVHQINLEWIATVAHQGKGERRQVWYPDSVVGTDSHTTMINGLGVLGWGVGGIEAEAVMLGQPVYMLAARGGRLQAHRRLREGVTATDMTLRIVQMLRKHGVVDKFVEFYGAGVPRLTLADRATIANMAPEYGATCGFFPVDEVTLGYLRSPAATTNHVENVRRVLPRAGPVLDSPSLPEPEFTDTLDLDLGRSSPSLAGPKRPQDRVALSAMKPALRRPTSPPRSATRATASRPIRPGHGARRGRATRSATVTS
jgi:aconitate hydratase